jgi:hypothetical protein
MSHLFKEDQTFCLLFTRRISGSHVYIDLPPNLAVGPEYHVDGLKGWYHDCWDYSDMIVPEESWLKEKWEAVITPSQRGRIKDV